MKTAIIVAIAAAAVLSACTSKETKVVQTPAPAPTVVVEQPAVVVPAPTPLEVMVTYALPAGFPAARQSAAGYCRSHYGSADASLVADDHAGHATFACVS
jgi:hypothetical protein